MTEEAHNPNQPLSSYEDLRGSARGQAGELWKAADKEEASLGAYYEQLKEDPRFTEEHKAELAWGRYNQAKEKIVEGREKAGEQLASDAATYRRQAIPMPPGEGPITQDAQKIIIGQNEASRISKKLDRISESAGGPFRADRSAMLREKFGRGLEVGGTVGGCVCRAVLSVADEHGVEIDAVVDGFRRPRHRELIERANHAEYLQQYLGKRLAEPSFEKPPSEKARISGIGARALADDPGTKPERKGPLPRKTQSHFTKTFSRFPTPQPDEVSARRKRRTNKRK